MLTKSSYETRWESLGIFSIFIVSNLMLVYAIYWIFREARWGRIFARFHKAKAE
jgi:ABC-type multidrug transport system permease subunit